MFGTNERSAYLEEQHYEHSYSDIKGFFRGVYFFFSLQWAITLFFCWWSNNYDYFANFQTNWYEIAIGTFIVGILLIIATFAAEPLQKRPASLGIFFIFTICLAWTVSYIHSRWFRNLATENQQIVIYIVALLLGLGIGLAVYAFSSQSEPYYYPATLYILGGTLIVFEGYLIFSNLPYLLLILFCAISIVAGFYLIYGTLNIIEHKDFKNATKQFDSAAGSVAIYFDGFLIFLRLCELVGRLFRKERY